MLRFLLSLILFSTPIQAIYSLTPTPTPTPTHTHLLGPGPIVSLWRALPNPVDGGNQQIRIANVGDAGTTLDDRSIYAASSKKTVPLTGFIGAGENTFISLPGGTLNNAGDIISLIKGGAIYQGYYDGPVAAGRWVQLKWTSETPLSTSVTPTPTPTATPDGVRLLKILPDSEGDDDNTGEGEKIWIKNYSGSDVNLTGWKISDSSDRQIINLSGTLPAETEAEFINESGDSIFNNENPDCLTLTDSEGNVIDEGTYAVAAEGVETLIIRPCPE